MIGGYSERIKYYPYGHWPYIRLPDDHPIPVEDEESNEVECNHKWIKTNGLHKVYEDCAYCSMKKEDFKK